MEGERTKSGLPSDSSILPDSATAASFRERVTPRMRQPMRTVPMRAAALMCLALASVSHAWTTSPLPTPTASRALLGRQAADVHCSARRPPPLMLLNGGGVPDVPFASAYKPGEIRALWSALKKLYGSEELACAAAGIGRRMSI
jgi:hypothetical protein